MSRARVRLAELMPIRDGSVDPARHLDEEFCLYSIPSFDIGEPEILRGAEIGSSKQIVRTGDVLLSRIVPHIRRAWIVGQHPSHRIIASGEWIVFRAATADSRYLRHYLTSDGFHMQLMNTVAGVGGSLLRARPSQVADIQVSLPELAEQRRIADILDKADAIRRKRREAIALSEELLRSAFLEMFGDPMTNPMGWPVNPMGDAIYRLDAGWSANGEARERTENEFGVLKISAVTSGIFRAEEHKAVHGRAIDRELVTPRRGDLLFSRANTRELVAATCLVERDEPRLFLPDKLWRIVPRADAATAPYLRFLLSHDRLRSELTKTATGTSGSMLNVSMDKLRGLRAPFPPIGLQNKFATLVWKSLSAKAQHQSAHVQTEDLFYSLVARAFSGAVESSR